MSGPFLFPPPAPVSLAIVGSSQRFPVRRVYCIGRNYAEHAREMGVEGEAAAPVFFLKPGDSVVDLPGPVRYPSATADLHHEVELVLALAAGGSDLDESQAHAAIFGHAIGLDLTRRDLQSAAKALRQPWDTGKSFEQAAPVGPIHPVADGHHSDRPDRGEISLEVNGQVRQRGDLAQMLLTPVQIVAALSRLYTLAPGDLVFTGTPAGVGPLRRGDRFTARIQGLASVSGTII